MALLMGLQYAQYMYDSRITHLPASWAKTDTDKAINGYSNGYTNVIEMNGHGSGASNGNLNDIGELPTSFLDDKAVRTVYGLVPLKDALDWPIFASYDELSGCASWMGGRIPTVDEVRSIYAHVNVLKREEAERKLGKTVPAVNA
jgi:L-histidine Nalpha-methyltransferase / hercynylcysteine S-oxide synthase